MYCYKLVIAYDGTRFHGWQKQLSKPTIVGTLAKVFTKVFDAPSVILGASRTDASVHALGQVARMRTPRDIDPESLVRAWNFELPQDIVIRSIERVPPTFHPFHDVMYKTYFYHFFLQPPLPFVQRYGYFVRYAMDIEKLNECLALFVGTHDFRSFTTGAVVGENTVRTIDSLQLTYVPSLAAYRLTFTGKSFLRHMIRRIVGACFQVASKKHLTVDFLAQALAQCNAHQPYLPSAPAQGLLLHSITYKGKMSEQGRSSVEPVNFLLNEVSGE